MNTEDNHLLRPFFLNSGDQFDEWGGARGIQKMNMKMSSKSLYERQICKVLLSDGAVLPITSEKLIKQLSFGGELNFANCQIIDYKNGALLLIDELGAIEKHALDDNYDHIDFTSTKDIFGEETLNNESKQEIEVDVLKFKSKIETNLQEVLFKLNNPRAERNGEKPPLQDSMSILVSNMILQPDQFDEIFTIQTDPPESPLMRRYLKDLSEKINLELDSYDELSNIEELQSLAYENAGYKGKSLKMVLDESLDYQDYFRFLLTKKDKLVVTTEQKEYVDKLCEIIKKEKFYSFGGSKWKIFGTIVGELDECKKFFFRETVPCISDSYFRYFLYLPVGFEQLNDYIQKQNLDLKIALDYQIKSKKKELDVYLFVCDKDFIYYEFHIKKSTIQKWNKRLQPILSIVDEWNGKILPYNFNNSSI